MQTQEEKCSELVSWFSLVMKGKLLKRCERYGGLNEGESVDGEWLLDRLLDEVEELKEAMTVDTDDGLYQIVDECADVANFAAMLAEAAMQTLRETLESKV